MLRNKHPQPLQGELESIDQRISDLSLVPIGTCVLNLRLDVPDGWIELDGTNTTEIEQSSYPLLARIVRSGGAASSSTRLVLPAVAVVSTFKWIIKGR